MQKSRRASLGLATAAWIALTLVCASAQNNGNSDEDWRTQQAKYDLFDREKLLAKTDDDLGYRIYDLKQNIKALQNALEACQNEQDRVRHELIIVRVKLLH